MMNNHIKVNPVAIPLRIWATWSRVSLTTGVRIELSSAIFLASCFEKAQGAR
jgi:hypothetical protein